MSVKHPVLVVTGSSGAGTSTVRKALESIFHRQQIKSVVVEGDSFHRYDRIGMRQKMDAAGAAGINFSHFGEQANQFERLQQLFRNYGENGTGQRRFYLHDNEEARLHGERLGRELKAGEFTPWEDIETGTDLLFYEGLHGLVKSGEIDMTRYVDLKVGVVPVVNLEWIQKIHRDKTARGYSTEAVTDTILRRMPDYLDYICPQFTHTDINFQRVPVVDTSNPPVARWIPTADESMVVIRFANPRGVDFTHLLAMIHNSFMSRANTLVIPGGKLDLAMQLIFTPRVLEFVDKRRKAL